MNRRPARIVLWLIFCCLSTVASRGVAAQNSQARTLHNQDVVALSKAGLSDAAIIAVIQKSSADFDLSPDGLVALRTAGVSNTIIEAMVGALSPPAPIGTATPAAAANSSTPLPSEYGYYLAENNKLVPIDTTPVKTVIGLRPSLGGAGWAVDGVAGQPGFQLKNPSPTFIFYQQNIDIQAARYGLATFVPSMRADEFNVAGTNPQFFPGIYHRNYNDLIPINLWRPKGGARFDVQPVVERSGMFKVHTQGPLPPGRYILFFENMIHMAGTVFATDQDEPFSAVFFEVLPDSSTALPGLPGTSATASAEGATQRDGQAAWDNAITLGKPVTFTMCHEKSFDNCEGGSFTLSSKEISFTVTGGKQLFAVPPSQVGAVAAFNNRLLSNASLRLKIGNKNYTFYPIPSEVTCQVDLYLKCPQQGIDEELIAAKYIAQAIPKLASGAPVTPAKQPAAQPSTAQ